jgi:peptide-methionine (S)-S-oxide reductase
MGEKGATSRAILGGGCFWCLEAAFLRLPGVSRVTSGYAGGDQDNPSYEQVCSGLTGHAEVVAVDFDPAVASYGGLLDLFFRIHDPTTQDRQGADVGSQYRSVIFYADDAQRAAALAARKARAPSHENPIVTEILPAPRFWPAEEYHRNYYDNHPGAGYCRAVIAPKLSRAGLKTAFLKG